MKINWENAGKIKSRTKLARKKYEGKITAKVIEKIQGFYLNDSISRVSTSKKNISKRTGTVRRYMKFSIKDVFIMFRNVEPEIKVSFSKFYMLKPKNVKTAGKTPMESSLCPYCLNVRLKLQKINNPNIKMEYDIFNYLTCMTLSKLEMEKAACISKTCEKCSNWEEKIDHLLSEFEVTTMDKDIIWYHWEMKEVTRKNGKIGYQRDLVQKKKNFC